MIAVNTFWFGALIAHVFYGVVFTAIVTSIQRPPSLIVGLASIFLWPVAVHALITKRRF